MTGAGPGPTGNNPALISSTVTASGQGACTSSQRDEHQHLGPPRASTGEAPPSSTPTKAPGRVTRPTVRVTVHPGHQGHGAVGRATRATDSLGEVPVGDDHHHGDERGMVPGIGPRATNAITRLTTASWTTARTARDDQHDGIGRARPIGTSTAAHPRQHGQQGGERPTPTCDDLACDQSCRGAWGDSRALFEKSRLVDFSRWGSGMSGALLAIGRLFPRDQMPPTANDQARERGPAR